MNVDIFKTTIEIDESVIAELPAVIREQVREYECGDRRTFDLNVTIPEGVTGEVMAAMTDIPYGETRTYGALAVDLDITPIVVGQACARNPVPLVVPCHRVVGSDGELKGYSAANGVTTKRRLLDHEARERGSKPVQTRLPMQSPTPHKSDKSDPENRETDSLK
jgi:methylated-DNA-[protein]-cysteine S-methyltransferase